MALSAKMEMRQGQALVMTPQLLQAIKLLQLSHVELHAFVENELERNPLLEREEAGDGPVAGDEPGGVVATDSGDFSAGEAEPGEWLTEGLSETREMVEANLDTSFENVFQDDRPAQASVSGQAGDMLPVHGSVSGGARPDGDDLPGFESSLTAEISLRDHLAAQLDISVTDPAERMVARFIIDAVDDNGYLTESLSDMAARLGLEVAAVEHVLFKVQRFDPVGIACRDAAECLALQLKEQDRFDPAMAAMIANLALVARRDIAALRRVCGVSDEDILDMIAEIRRLDPKPGRAFGGSVGETVVPDVVIRAAPDGSWRIDLNPDTLPRVLINQNYHATISRAAKTDDDKNFLAECLQNASWLTRSLEQRARTILKVASEIVRQQDGFFAYGAAHLRPLNLKTIADAISMHESTVSRVTSNKYLICPRGLFEMKYFFSASIPATGYGEAHSAEAVRFRIRQLIEAEGKSEVLSDDAIVTQLKSGGIDIARRTVAKYRESLRIPSSMDRRRQKLEEAREWPERGCVRLLQDDCTRIVPS